MANCDLQVRYNWRVHHVALYCCARPEIEMRIHYGLYSWYNTDHKPDAICETLCVAHCS